MYGGKWGAKNLGNTEAGDGAKFKGRGFTQLTGRANYTAAAKATGLDLVNHPELAADQANAATLAVWFHKSKAGLAEASRNGDVVTARQKLNGGKIGLDEVKEKFDKYLPETMARAASSAPVVAVNASSANVTPTTPAAVVNTSVVPNISVASAVSAPNAGMPSVTIPAPPAAPPTAVAAIPTQLNSSAPLRVSLADNQQVSQDLRDRRLAQIVTGGVAT